MDETSADWWLLGSRQAATAEAGGRSFWWALAYGPCPLPTEEPGRQSLSALMLALKVLLTPEDGSVSGTFAPNLCTNVLTSSEGCMGTLLPVPCVPDRVLPKS